MTREQLSGDESKRLKVGDMDLKQHAEIWQISI